MLKAFSRLLFIAIGSVLCIAFALVVLRQLGEGQGYADSDHPLMKEKSWLIYDLSISDVPDQKVLNQPLILKLPIRLTNDGVWVVSRHEALTNQNGKIKPIIAMSSQELEKQNVKSLEATVQSFEKGSEPSKIKAYYFYVLDASASRLEELSTLAKTLNLKDRVLFASPYMRVNIEMRKVEPLWLYGASTTDISKFRFFTSLYIESLATSNSDFAEFMSIPQQRLVDEVNHRKRRALLYLKTDLPQEKLPRALGGWVISDPSLLAKYIALAPL